MTSPRLVATCGAASVNGNVCQLHSGHAIRHHESTRVDGKQVISNWADDQTPDVWTGTTLAWPKNSLT